MKTCLLCTKLGYGNKPKSERLSLFELPSNPAQRELWEDVLKKVHLDKVPVKNPKICEKHFQPVDFSNSTPSRKRLHPWAVPTILIKPKLKHNSENIKTDILMCPIADVQVLEPKCNMDVPVSFGKPPRVTVGTQNNIVNWKEQENIRADIKVIKQHTRRLEAKNRKMEEHLHYIKKKLAKSEVVSVAIRKIIDDASENNQQAVMLLDRIINYGKWNKVSWKLISPEEDD